MKIQEQLKKVEEQLKKVQSVATKTATNTEKYHWEVKQLGEGISELIKLFSETNEMILALLKQQIGD